ncbi:MAG: hypothetical protein LQ345_005375 [Seirophora villosa]|nr:MAG: hypothetical protein LQ345_005375 [Seirophora villosa]
MSRTVADATRFTATSPHAYSKPSSILRSANATFSPSSYSASGSAASQSRKPPPLSNPPPSQQQPPSKPPQHETPAQKVARLRALRAAEKLKPLSLWDRTVVRGRRWADVAHRTTALGLMGVTLLAGAITAFSLTDMLIYNRNQRRLYYSTQAAIYTETLQSAIEAEQTGRPFTDEESSVLNREKAVLAAEAAREKRTQAPWTTRAKQFFLGVGEEGGGMKGEVLGVNDAEAEGQVDLVGGEGAKVKDVGDLVGQSRVMQALQEKKQREGEKPLEEARAIAGPLQSERESEEGKTGSAVPSFEQGVVPVDGQLDRVAEEAVEKGKEGLGKAGGGGWSAWFGGSR